LPDGILFYICGVLSTMMLRRLCIAVLVVFLAGCGTPHSGKNDGFQVAVLKGPSAISMIKMVDEGFSYQGRQADFRIYNEPDQVKALMIRKQAGIVLLPANMAAVLYNKGVPDYLLAAVPVWGSLYLAGTDTSVHSVDNLRGKTIYLMARGATPDIVFRYILKAHRIDPENDLRLDYTFNGHFELASAVTAGRAPMGVISEPFVSLSSSKNPDTKVLIDLEKEWDRINADSVPMVQTAVMINRNFLEKNRELVKEFFRNYGEAISWLGDHHHEAARLIVKHDIVPNEEVAYESLRRIHIRFAYAREERTKIDRYWQILFTFNPDAVGGRLPDERFYAEIDR